MRLFIAVELPDSLKDRLARLKTDIPGATWSRRETYHLTLRFLGDDIPESKVPELHAALSAIHLPDFDVTLQGVGRFPPNPKSPARVLWVGLAPNPPLMVLVQAVEHAVKTVGFPPEDRDFSGHITLARLKSTQPEPAAAAFLRDHADFRTDPFRAGAFHLISSVLSAAGPHYTVLSSFMLEG